MLRQRGSSYVEVAEALRRQFALSARAAFRVAHGWSQREAAEEWSQLWPDDPKTAKNISYWELWPGKTGHAPSLDVIEKLAELYQCSVADLLADRGNYRDLDSAHRRPGNQSTQATGVSAREAPHGWYIKSLVTLLQLDLDAPVALEERTIVATRDDLDEIDTTMSVPRHPEDSSQPHRAEIEVLSGGRLERREQPHESQFRHVIALAQPLAAGDEHLYRLAIRIPPSQLMINHAVHVPLQRSDHFNLTVRFSLEKLPPGIWLGNGVPPAVLRDREPRGRQVTPDRFGEVNVSFGDLLQGQAYGLRWGY
jgi:transcriptional regulator with XRE-family HTH domain